MDSGFGGFDFSWTGRRYTGRETGIGPLRELRGLGAFGELAHLEYTGIDLDSNDQTTTAPACRTVESDHRRCLIIGRLARAALSTGPRRNINRPSKHFLTTSGGGLDANERRLNTNGALIPDVRTGPMWMDDG